jgi:hypothetical protein
MTGTRCDPLWLLSGALLACHHITDPFPGFLDRCSPSLEVRVEPREWNMWIIRAQTLSVTSDPA